MKRRLVPPSQYGGYNPRLVTEWVESRVRHGCIFFGKRSRTFACNGFPSRMESSAPPLVICRHHPHLKEPPSKASLPSPLQNPLFFSSLPLCRSACEATDKVRGCGGANTCILRPQGMIEAAVSRKNMWLVRVAAVTLGRSGCPCVPFCLHSDPPPPVLVEVGTSGDELHTFKPRSRDEEDTLALFQTTPQRQRVDFEPE
ncbi:uncharacterized protein TNCV_852061 [Trichonephila clavipes]|nr:uncharacterized protein TNCV_852061 [Trichonephila clavipes]